MTRRSRASSAEHLSFRVGCVTTHFFWALSGQLQRYTIFIFGAWLRTLRVVYNIFDGIQVTKVVQLHPFISNVESGSVVYGGTEDRQVQ